MVTRRHMPLALLPIMLVTSCAGMPALASNDWQPRLRKAGHCFE